MLFKTFIKVSTVQVCDATMFNSCSSVWLKIFLYIFTFAHLHIFTFDYSVLKLFTGFAIAAFIAWKLTVTNATMQAAIAAMPNTHQCDDKLIR